MILQGFVGPSYVSVSPNISVETLQNWYPQTVEVPSEKARIVYYPTPGLSVFASLSDFPLRALFEQNGRAFAVGGQTLFELFTNATPTNWGSLSAKDANPATITSNGTAGHQLYITSGGKGDIFDLNTNTITPITAAGYPTATVMGTYLDTYFLTTKGNSAQFNICGVLDGLSWSALDFSIRVQASDNLVGIIQNNKTIWMIGSQTSEPWYDAGAATFPFQSVPQVLVPIGCCAPFSIIRNSSTGGGSVGWLHQTERGQGMFMVADSYQPQRVSTYAVEAIWRSYPTMTDCVGYCYTDQGHQFVVLTFPSGNATWVYDFTEGLWHQRTWLNPQSGNEDRHRGWVHCAAFNTHLVGDWDTGTVYEMSTTIQTDFGYPIQRRRRAPHLSSEQTRNFFANFQLDMETGLGTTSGQGVTPVVVLQWSDDGGHTWSAGIPMNAGANGQYQTRCRAAGNLGSSRDRVFQITCSDPIPYRIQQAYLDVIAGTS